MATKKAPEVATTDASDIMAEAAAAQEPLPPVVYDTSEIEGAFDDMTVVDDGEGYRYATVSQGVRLRGVGVAVEESDFGFSLVFITGTECAATKKRDGTKIEELLPPGAHVRIGYRKKLDPIFQMVKNGLRPPFEILFLGKQKLNSGNTMWNLRLNVSLNAMRQFQTMSNAKTHVFEGKNKD